jgi:hypothetical protein
MLGSSNRGDTRSTFHSHTQHIECELCEEVRLCTERCRMITCQDCQADFLPRRRFL